MGKILASWSGMRKYLEQEMIADCLKGRVRYNCTAYTGMDGCRIFEIFIDKKLVKQFSWETVNTYFIDNNISASARHKHPAGTAEYWEGFWETLDRVPMNSRTEYTDEEFCEALEQYRNQPIQHSISSENPLVRMFAVLDRRVGKRTLKSISEHEDIQPEWLNQLCKLRVEAENL